MNLLTKTVLSFFGACVMGALPINAQAANKFITIGTAGVTGVYFPAGGAICRLVNIKRKEHGIKCSVESTGGSIYNLNAIRQGELDLGVAQSDWQYHAYNGTGNFEPQGKFEKLRSVFAMHSEPFTVVARADAEIKEFTDLKDKRVNIGNPGSGMRATMEEVMKANGWTRDSFALVSELKASEQGQALCDNKVDAIVYAAGHPNGAIQEVTSTCDTVMIDVTGDAIDTLVNANPFYSFAEIPGGMYKGNDKPTKTFGVKATFVSSADVDNDLIYQTVKAVFDRFEDFKTLHPVFSTLQPEKMIFDGTSAPLHEGAKRYFAESGLLAKAEALQKGDAAADTKTIDPISAVKQEAAETIGDKVKDAKKAVDALTGKADDAVNAVKTIDAPAVPKAPAAPVVITPEAPAVPVVKAPTAPTTITIESEAAKKAAAQ